MPKTKMEKTETKYRFRRCKVSDCPYIREINKCMCVKESSRYLEYTKDEVRRQMPEITETQLDFLFEAFGYYDDD